ncbi:SPOR domain-containing protein [Rhodobacteraceae bacterium CCMM004]|nr:SPOR domain-containing protein [Rhodobacteraceae bacterium CCMM004]
MLFKSAAAVLALALVAGGPLPATAQSFNGADVPTEFPPSSYTGRQYVDSRGCVYIRAGFAGAVEWVPRVSRRGKVMCGFQPSLPGRSAQAEAPVIRDAPAAAPPRQATVAAAPRVVRAPVAATPRVVRAPVVQAPAPVRRPTPQRTVRTVACPGAAPVSGAYINPGARCGPQTQLGWTGLAPAATTLPAGTAVVSGARRTVLGPPAGSTVRVPVPPQPRVLPGYRAAWDDGRLNPHRGKQTLRGALQTALVWTQTVPRRLVDRATGHDVTNRYNYLVYPYTDYNKQKADLAGGRKIVVITRAGRAVVDRSAVRTTADGRVVLTSKGAAAAPAPKVQRPTLAVAPKAPAAAGGAYVQVGTYADPANAQRATARLRAAGLPVRQGQVRRGGKVLRVVLAGPFADGGQRALATARRAGFSDAFLRR